MHVSLLAREKYVTEIGEQAKTARQQISQKPCYGQGVSQPIVFFVFSQNPGDTIAQENHGNFRLACPPFSVGSEWESGGVGAGAVANRFDHDFVAHA